MKVIMQCVGVLILTGLLLGCHNQEKKKEELALKKETIITAKLESPVLRLYYSGVLRPISMSSILSPVTGHVVGLKFDYGRFIEKGQSLVVIASLNLTQTFRKAITDYLQKKSTLAQSVEKFRGTKALHAAKVISDEDYLTEKVQYQTNELSFFQSQYAMEKVLARAGIDSAKVERLTLEDKKQIIEYLKKQFKHVLVKSTASGIALFPGKSDGAGGASKLLAVGTSVKEAQLLLTIGDLSGFASSIQVSEVNINRIEKGMLVTVTSAGFPGITLHGKVAVVSAQAKSEGGDGSSSATFMVAIEIPNIAKKYRKIIRVGMTSKVEIDIKKQPVIMLPIAAVFQKKGKAAVTLVNKTGKRRVVSVVVGFTSPTQIAIVRGVKAGDRVLVPGESSQK